MSGSPTDKKIKGIVTVGIFISLAVGLFFFLERQKKQRNLNQARQERIQAVREMKKANRAQRQANVTLTSDSEKVAPNQDQDDLDSRVAVVCTSEDSTPSVSVSQERFLNLLRQDEVWVPVVSAQNCFKVGSSVTLLAHKAEGRIIYESTPRGKVKIEKIEEATFSQVTAEKKFLINGDEKQAIERALTRRNRLTGEKIEKAKIKFLLLRKEAWAEWRRNYGAPMVHPMARTIDLNEFKAALAKGEIPFDVRPEIFFKAKTITGAANAPASSFDQNQFLIHSPSELAALKFRINTSVLPKDKDTSFIVFSSCGADFLSYNAITHLRHQGYRDIRWFRGGLENWVSNGGGCGTPNKLADMAIVDGAEVKKHLGDQTSIVFVHSGFNLRNYEIKDSLSMKYQQKFLGDLMAAFRPTTVKEMTEKFEASGDEAVLEPLKLDPNARIIVYGRNEFDWKPLKVALLLKSKGFRNVSWYRTGIEDWLNRALFKPGDFLTKPEYVRQ